MAAAWGAGIFQDDMATDFSAQIVESDGLAVLRRTFDDAARARGHLLYEPAVRTLIAAEVLAALGGRPTRALPPELQDWISGRQGEAIPEALWPLSRLAVERVKDDSEISELWARSDAFARWIDKVDDLLSRLAQSDVAGTSLG
jgi:Domain of unknown function (DUF4259)